MEHTHDGRTIKINSGKSDMEIDLFEILTENFHLNTSASKTRFLNVQLKFIGQLNCQLRHFLKVLARISFYIKYLFIT